jgi:hypothetical protein
MFLEYEIAFSANIFEVVDFLTAVNKYTRC